LAALRFLLPVRFQLQSGRAKLTAVLEEKKAAQKHKQALEDAKTPVDRQRDLHRKRREDHLLASRDKRYSVNAAYGDLITHIGD
jgi:hypothetical protein